MAGVKKQFFGAGIFTKHIGDLLIGEFLIKDYRQHFTADFVNKECQGRSRCLGFRRTAGKGGIISQAVGLSKVKEGKRSPNRRTSRRPFATAWLNS